MTTDKRMSTIDKHSMVPIYIQLKNSIRAEMDIKRIRPNEKIPSENMLAKEYGINRMTVRHAMRELQKEGRIFTKHGKGSFASSLNNTQMLVKLDGFSTEMIKLGYTVHSKLIEAKKAWFSNETMDAYSGLQEEKQNPLIVIRRIRYLEGKPFAIESSYLPFYIGRNLLVKTFNEKFSIYRYLEEEHGISFSCADHVIEPKRASPQDAALLGIKKGMPVLFISGVTFSESGEPVEYIKGIYRGDRYKLKVHIKK
jgi:GntR family transcriptional regulator